MIMTYIYLNYENMKNVIASLASYANKAENAQSDVAAANEQNNNPSSLSNVSKLSGKVQELRDKAKEIDDRVEIAKAQNESGITAKDSSGSIAYYIPDTMEDNIDNAKSANQAIDDARTLKEKKGKSGENEVLDQIKQRSNSNAYSASFVEHYGARETMKIAQNAEGGPADTSDPKYKIAANLIARASRTWDKGKSQEISNSIVDYLRSGDREGKGPVVTFAGVMESANVPFGKDFLVSLANGIEPFAKLSPPKAGGVSVGGHTISSEGGGRSLFLPLNSVLTAMRSCPEAALEYAVPDPNANADGKDPDNDPYKRIKEKISLGNMGSSSQLSTKWNDNWAAIMGRAADKFGYEKVDETHPATDNAKRSAFLAAAGVDWFGETNDRTITPEARRNLASVARCYAWSVDKAARSGDLDGNISEETIHIEDDPTDKGADKASAGLTYQPKFNADKLAKVLGAISRDSNEFSRVTSSVGELNANRVAYATDLAANGDSSGLKFATGATSAARGYLIGAGHAENEKDAASKDARNQEIIDTVMGLTSFVPGLGQTATYFQKSAYSYAQNRGSDWIKSGMQDSYTSNLNAALAKNGKVKADAAKRTQIDLLCGFANGGVIKGEEQLNNFRMRAPSCDVNSNCEQLSEREIEDLDDIVKNGTGVLNTEQQLILSDAEQEYQKGYRAANKK